MFIWQTRSDGSSNKKYIKANTQKQSKLPVGKSNYTHSVLWRYSKYSPRASSNSTNYIPLFCDDRIFFLGLLNLIKYNIEDRKDLKKRRIILHIVIRITVKQSSQPSGIPSSSISLNLFVASKTEGRKLFELSQSFDVIYLFKESFKLSEWSTMRSC